MSDSTVTGTVHVVEPTKTFGQKGFRKRLVVLEQPSGRFTSYIPVEFVQDACDSVDGLKEGDEVEVTYRLNGRKWQRDANSEVKYFLSAEAIGYRVLNSSGAGNDEIAEFGQEPPDALEDDTDVPF